MKYKKVIIIDLKSGTALLLSADTVWKPPV